MKTTLAVFLFLISFPLISAAEQKRFDFMQKHMGTAFRITIYAESAADAKKAAERAFEKVALVDRALSDYQPASELALLQKDVPLDWRDISPAFARALKTSLEISEKTGGLFDVSLGTLTRLWRKAREAKKLPSRTDLAVARSNAGFKLIEYKNDKIRFRKPGVQLDFGGIGKGIAVDEAFESLERSGFKAILVAGGGDLRAGGPPPGRQAWRIGIASVSAHHSGSFVEIRDRALSTSGDLEQFIEIENRRYSHIIDPRTGLGSRERKVVTVTANNSATADAMATALVMADRKTAGFLARRMKDLEFVASTPQESFSSKRFPKVRLIASNAELKP